MTLNSNLIKQYTDGSKLADRSIKYLASLGIHPGKFQPEIHAIGRCLQTGLMTKKMWCKNKEIKSQNHKN